MTPEEMKKWNKKRETLEKRLGNLLEANPVDIAAFNTQREKLRNHGCMDLYGGAVGLYLRKKECPYIDFENIWFKELEDVCLDHANLRGSHFDYVRIKNTRLRYADIRDAAHFLSKVDICGTVDLSYADLRGIRLDTDYKEYTQRMISRAIFYQTKITEEQEQKLRSEFDISEQYLAKRFEVIAELKR